jgi:hypothetical protein
MQSSGMLHHATLVRNDVLEETSTYITEALGFSETSVLTRAIRHNIPKDDIFHRHRHENLKSYIRYICTYYMFRPPVAIISM